MFPPAHLTIKIWQSSHLNCFNFIIAFVGGEKKKKTLSSALEISNRPSSQFRNTFSFVMEQEKLRCRFCNIIFPSLLQLEHHYSDTQHRVNVIKLTQKLHSATKFRSPPDGVYMGRYKMCRR